MKNPFENKDTTVFLRIKDECKERFLKNTKQHTVLFSEDDKAILKMSEFAYQSHRTWLIHHSLLSCVTEIQVIKIKQQITN